MVESMRSPTRKWKVTFTISLSGVLKIFSKILMDSTSMVSVSGGVMSTARFSMTEREVAALPIIWFMASEMAESCRSETSP